MRLCLVILGRLFLCLLTTATRLPAQSYDWRNAEVGGGGFVSGIVFHPNEPNLVYARTDVGGMYRLDPATNRWVALNDDIGGLNNEFQHLGVISIGLDPNDANRVYIATGQYAGAESWKLPSRIYRSSNRGATWTYTTPGFKMAGNGEGRGTGERIAVDPNNGSNLLIGSNNAGIWRSSDSGATWSRSTSFPSILTNLTLLAYAPTSHANPGPNRRLYAGANTLSGSSFWFSDDNGDTWSEVPNHPGNSPGTEMMPLQVSFDAAGTLYSTWGNTTGPANYASTYGVWKLSADATTWTPILPPTGQGFFGGICADPQIPGHVVVSTLLRWWPGDEIYRSTDGGASWSPVLRTATRSTGNSPWATPSPHWITDIEIDPHHSERVFFNTGFGLFQTTNLSASGTSRLWTFSSDGLEEAVPIALLSPTAGPPLVSVIGDYTGFRHDYLDRSPAQGALSPGSGSTSVISGALLSPTTMIRQNNNTTFYSRDAAATWAVFPTTPEPIINGHHRVISSADGLCLLWCPPNSPAFRSSDHGTSWAVVASSGSLIQASGTPTFGVLAGKSGVSGTTNATGGDARFQLPSAIALDFAGVRYIADTANHTVRRITTNGGTNTLAGGAGVAGSTDAIGTNARFNLPAGIAVDPNKTVFVADTANHTIRKISTSGGVTTLAGIAGLSGSSDGIGSVATFNLPTGLTLDSIGNLYVCDTANHSIRKITPTGEVSTFAGSPGLAGSDDGNRSAARFNAPRGITIDPSGNLYVADTENHTIRKISPSSDVSTFAGLATISGATDATGSAARFNTPKSLTCDASGVIHVADSGNHVIRKISADGTVSTVAGIPGTAGFSNGNASAATFSNPSGIVASANGINLYVCDTENHTVRRGYPYNTLVPIADSVNPSQFYLWDGTAKRLISSTDGGMSFSVIGSNVNSAVTAFHPVPGHQGHLWARAEDSGLFVSTNSGVSFSRISAVTSAYRVAFGKAKDGSSHPAAYIWGKIGGVAGFFRSDDAGATWSRINDDLHQFGYQNDLAADPRIYGRVYLATSGRGVIIGDIKLTVLEDATIILGDLNPIADGSPKSPSVTTDPPGLPVSLSFNNSDTPPSLAGSYTVTATVNHPNYAGVTQKTFVIRQAKLSPTPVTGWVSNVSGKVSFNEETPSSPMLNPNDTTDAYSTNTLQARFNPITLVNPGDKITLTGAFQLTHAGIASQSSWFRFGLYNHRNQAPTEVNGWLGLTSIGSALWERTSTGLFSTGSGATSRTLNALPIPISLTSPTGNPPVNFEITATRRTEGVDFSYQLTHADTQAVLLSYSYTDLTPNNNNIFGSVQNSSIEHSPTFTTAGFAFSRSYIASSGAQAQFSEIRIAFQPALSALDAWRYTSFGTLENSASAADTADPDSDGLNNLLEFALGLDPNLPSTHPLGLKLTGSTIELSYTRLKAALPLLSFSVEWSDSLEPNSWSSSETVEISPPIADDGIRETIKVLVPANTDQRFMRLKVTLLE